MLAMSTLAERVREAIGRDVAAEVSRKLASIGVVVSYQAVHKWLRGGNISDEKIAALAQVYGVSEAWLKYGTGARTRRSEALVEVGDIVAVLDPESRKQAIGYLEFLLSRQGMPPELMGRYLGMIDKIKRDMDGKQ